MYTLVIENDNSFIVFLKMLAIVSFSVLCVALFTRFLEIQTATEYTYPTFQQTVTQEDVGVSVSTWTKDTIPWKGW